MRQEYHSINVLFLVILKCFINIVLGVGFYLIIVSLGKELVFIKRGKRVLIMKSVESLTVKTRNLQKSTKSKPRKQITLLVFSPITS